MKHLTSHTLTQADRETCSYMAQQECAFRGQHDQADEEAWTVDYLKYAQKLGTHGKELYADLMTAGPNN